MKICEDCKEEISCYANHTGKERWCESCFDKGLSKDMNEHFDNFIKQELEKPEVQNGK